MKKIFAFIVVCATLCLSSSVWAQQIFVKVDATTNGTVVDAIGGTVIVTDDDSQGLGAPDSGNYQYGVDRYVTILGNCIGESRMSFRIDQLSVDCLDTVYVYDGQGINGTLIAKFNSFTDSVTVGDKFFETPANTTGMMTVRFKSDPRTDSEHTSLSCHGTVTPKGFRLIFTCGVPCEYFTPVIDSMFYRTRHGEIYDSAYTRMVYLYDTIYNEEDDTSSGIASIDTISFLGAHLCIGDGVIFRGHGEYTYNYGYYTPSDETSYFIWDMANEGDSIQGTGVYQIEYHDYQRTGCYDIRLDIIDEYGCTSDVFYSVRVRTSKNPIKTIYTLADICNRDSLMVNMGYDGENATLTLSKIETDSAVSKTFDVRTFIPDGCNCGTAANNYVSYYEAPVEFTEFPNYRQVNSARDICSVCINMEHSFMGDIYMTLVCPTGQEAILKFGNKSAGQQSCTYPDDNLSQGALNPAQATNGTNHGSGTFLGVPLDTQGGGSWDKNPKCDSLMNPYGFGLDYCFSRDTGYTLVTGDNARAVWLNNPNPAGNFYIVSGGYTINYPVTYTAIPSYFDQGGLVPEGTSITTKQPSDHENKSNYYLPWTTFQELVGCPLNGTWKIRVYDVWGADNGWIFNWSLDICDVRTNEDCDYQVGIDSLVWTPDPDSIYHDYELGYYRGAKVHQETPTISHIMSPDTAGTFPILVKVYDEFGCEWDTATRITTYWTPTPNIGADTALCGVDTMLLDATDRHSVDQGYTYVWEPFGQNTPTIYTQQFPASDMRYVVRVDNLQHNTRCFTRDTINVRLRRQPLPSFYPTPFVFEGCDPFTLHFENQSVEADKHLWVFGDGLTSTLANPTHTYAAGVYDLKYYATSDDGCIDSVISPQSIAVYTAPKAAFAWEPLYPSVLNPVVQLDNRTTPTTPDTKYFWELQYNPDNPISVHTVTDQEPVFNFSQYMEGDPSGLYSVRLIARTDNVAPSGNIVYCRDTTENTILLVNDFLQFPNVVTPNGDGINDRFVIQNLITGMGYPANTLDIYNKWGARVYHKENISRDEDFWDPANMPAGTYFYRFSARGYNGNIEHNGAIEVVK